MKKTTAQTTKSTKVFQKGFTLVELLVVIAILGVLASVVVVAVDPLEQLARSRDAGRKSAGGQIARALQQYRVLKVQSDLVQQYPDMLPANNPQGTDWMNTLVDNRDLLQAPPTIAYAVGAVGGPCTSGAIANNFCYYESGVNALLVVGMESRAENVTKCGGGGVRSWWMWSSVVGRSGIHCTSGEPNNADSTYTIIP